MPKCDPVHRRRPLIDFRPSSIGDPEWGMYVTPDDPLRDTPEKARCYYERLFRLIGLRLVKPDATDADITAAGRLLGV